MMTRRGLAAAVVMVVVVGVLAGGVAAEAETPKCENGDTRYVPTPQAADEEFDSGTQSVSYQECDAGSWVTKALIPAATSNEKTVITVSAGRESSSYDFATDQGDLVKPFGTSAPTWAASGVVADRHTAVQLAQAALDPRIRAYNNRMGTNIRVRCLAVAQRWTDTASTQRHWEMPRTAGTNGNGPLTYRIQDGPDAPRIRQAVDAMVQQWEQVGVARGWPPLVEAPADPSPTVTFGSATFTDATNGLATTRGTAFDFINGVRHWRAGDVTFDLARIDGFGADLAQTAAHEFMHVLGFSHLPSQFGGTMGYTDNASMGDETQSSWSVNNPDPAPFDGCAEEALR